MLSILAAIMLATATLVNQVTAVISFNVTSNVAAKKSFTTCPRSPIVLNKLPKTRQNSTIPMVLVPDRWVSTRTNVEFTPSVLFVGR